MPERFRQQEELYCLDFFYHCHHYCHWDHRSGEDSGEEKGTGSFLLERGKQGDNKAALDFQCLLLFAPKNEMLYLLPPLLLSQDP